jgi:hypothetical protein
MRWLEGNPGGAICILKNARCSMRELAKRTQTTGRIGMGLSLGILALTLTPLGCQGVEKGGKGQTIVPTTGQAKTQAGAAAATSAPTSTPSFISSTSAPAVPGRVSRRRPQSLQPVASASNVPRISNQVEQPASAEARVWAAQLEAMQREQDERLLRRQQADSQRQQQQQEQAVQRRAKEVQAQQDEPRIQDAPGPGETGLLPGMPPPPSQPSNGEEQRIQDAPGPAQTIPAPQPSQQQPQPEAPPQ